MTIFNFLKNVRTIDVSNLDFKLFEKYGWELNDRAKNDLKKFPIEEFREGPYGIMPCLFKKVVKTEGFRDCTFNIWVQIGSNNKVFWSLMCDDVLYEIDKIPNESDLIKFDDEIKKETNSWKTN